MTEDREPNPATGAERFDPFLDEERILRMVTDATEGLEALLKASAAADRYADGADDGQAASGSN